MKRRRHKRITLTRKISRGIIILIICLLVVITGTGIWVYHHLNQNITSVDTTKQLGTDRPTMPTDTSSESTGKTYDHPVNILLVGSDSRKGSNIKGYTPGLSDTTILVHINASHTAATAVSIPRDSMVDRPACLDKNGEEITAPEFGQFNAAYSQGGIACTQRTVEQLTGIRINHFAVINLAGFQKMVDALGGVPICVPEKVDDTIGKIFLPAGSYTADGKQALDYVRERHTLSLNGDLGRVKRQQVFLASMVNKALSLGTLTNPVKLYQFLDAVTDSLTTDPGLASVEKLAKFAKEVENIPSNNIRLFTIPTEPYPADPNRLIWTNNASKIWDALKNDTQLPKSLITGTVTNVGKTSQSGSTTVNNDHKTRKVDDNGLCEN